MHRANDAYGLFSNAEINFNADRKKISEYGGGTTHIAAMLRHLF